MKTMLRIFVSTLALGALTAVALSGSQTYASPSRPHALVVEQAVKSSESAVVHDVSGEGSESTAYASSPSEGTHHGEGGGEHKAGLPQLNPEYFPAQIFWLLVNFAVLYLLMANVALPGVKATQESRRRTIKRDLAEAKAASEAAQAARALSEKVLADARAKAVAAVASIKSVAAQESAERQTVLQNELVKRVRDAEIKIAKTRTEALQDVHDKAAAMIASDILSKVARLNVDPSRLTLSVGERGRAGT